MKSVEDIREQQEILREQLCAPDITLVDKVLIAVKLEVYAWVLLD